MEVGGWVQVSHGFFCWNIIPKYLFVYTLLKVVSYYDLSVLSMSVRGFQKKFGWGWGVGGWGELYPTSFWIFGNFVTLQNPLCSGWLSVQLPTYYNKSCRWSP